ncbi:MULTISPECIES: putative bifunctional diguanylate cyclase/phosphodiesterase [unclassified Aureimonas]|uniref:putative bifunctional diguanylate cyclase/phosphodiesterase n=1 Tax=unclassified Aureimonas TaxID=2615206 RepID=UPI000AF2DDA8|nr:MULTISPECIES: bifunctional diguanylate cyclase/phosphodiesterase [unclassified Aureimonas]
MVESKWELPLIAATAGLGFAAVTMLFSSVQYMDGISRAAENNVVYEVMTTSPELARLQMTVAARFLPDSGISDDDVALRFGILENRMVVLGTVESRRLRQDSAEATVLIERMQRTVADIAPWMEHMETPVEAAAVLKAIEPLNSAAARLAALTTSTSATRIAENRAMLIEIFWQLLVGILGLLACGMILVAMLRRARKRARHSAHYDVLTALPNRLSYNIALEEEFERGGRPGSLVVVMFDLDLFKQVNDTMGHAAGDRLLSLVSRRLSTALPDAVIFARLGGDEFAAIFRALHPKPFGESVGRRILACFERPFEIDGSRLAVSTSVGIAVSDPGDATADDLLKRADLALYAVKEDRRGAFKMFQPALKEAYLERQTFAKDLETALARNQLELHFQPIVDLRSDRTAGFEALLRWHHPTKGLLSPSLFIPIAEETALILPIGRWAIAEACAAAAHWPDDVSIAVNLSPRQFGDPQLQESVRMALTRHGIRPARLTLEITESVLIQNDATVLDTLTALREMGVRISLDDFGTGYASLSYLTRFPFDAIKIDQSFMRVSPAHPHNPTIVETICDLAAKLGLCTVAEGIETPEQLDMIRRTGCRKGQGYLFDQPMTLADCATRLALERLRSIQAPPKVEIATRRIPGATTNQP